jgi:hypothetical protein
MSSREQTRRREQKKKQEKGRQFARQQTRRRQREAIKKEEKEKRVANLFQRIVGITAARGYNRNMPQNVGLVSKAVSQNVLLQGAQKKRQQLNASNAEIERLIGELSFLLNDWKYVESEEYKANLKQQIDTYLTRIHQILSTGGTVYAETLGSIWRLDPLLLNSLLKENPILRELSATNKNGIYDKLQEKYEEAKDSYNGSVRGLRQLLRRKGFDKTRAHRFVPSYITYNLGERLYHLYRFDAFLNSYHSETGEYSLYSSNYNAYMNELETNTTINTLFENDEELEEIENIIFRLHNNNNNDRIPWINMQD